MRSRCAPVSKSRIWAIWVTVRTEAIRVRRQASSLTTTRDSWCPTMFRWCRAWASNTHFCRELKKRKP